MSVTIDDIARLSGVGRTTVFRALKGKDRISPETRAKIQKIAEELNYRPNPMATGLAKGTTNFVGILATPSIIPVFQAVLEPIDNLLREAGYNILLQTSSGRPEDEHLSLEQLMHQRVAGLIVHPSSTHASPEIYQELVESGVKLVIIDRYIEGVHAPQIVGDDYNAAYLATKYLISLGHRDIVHMAIPMTSYAGQERDRGFRTAMTEAGIPVIASSVVETRMGSEHGEQVMAKILKRKKVPTAILARQDVVAIGAMRAIYAAGLSIPDDISIVGNGDFWCDDMLRVSLTTVQHPVEQMANLAAQHLLDMLSGKSIEPSTTVLDVQLIVRGSCAVPKAKK